MTGKGKTGRAMTYLLIVLLLTLTMTTAIGFRADGSAMPFSGISGRDMAGSTTMHNGLGNPARAEVLEEVYPTWDVQLEYQTRRDNNIVPAVTVSVEDDRPANSLFVSPEEACLKLDPCVIAGFLQNEDGMK